MGKAAKAAKKRRKGNADEDAAVSDERFSRVHSDPRFQRINKVSRRRRPQTQPPSAWGQSGGRPRLRSPDGTPSRRVRCTHTRASTAGRSGATRWDQECGGGGALYERYRAPARERWCVCRRTTQRTVRHAVQPTWGGWWCCAESRSRRWGGMQAKQRVAIDARFASMFTDDRFKENRTVDKRGRKIIRYTPSRAVYGAISGAFVVLCHLPWNSTVATGSSQRSQSAGVTVTGE
jgi:hypothetical protein